eukprot:Skav203234  [mRNA]  locus=scaffold438:101922:111461:- [translate_table: standard]
MLQGVSLGGEEPPLDRRRRRVGVREPSSRRFWPSLIISSLVIGLPLGHLGPSSSNSFRLEPEPDLRGPGPEAGLGALELRVGPDCPVGVGKRM